jgi:hypothetical protein
MIYPFFLNLSFHLFSVIKQASKPLIPFRNFMSCVIYIEAAAYRNHLGLKSVCPKQNLSLSQNLSGLLFKNYQCNFIQILQEQSVPSVVMHIVGIYKYNDFCHHYDPFMIFIFDVCPVFYTTNTIWNKCYRIDWYQSFQSPCVHLTGLPVEWILAGSWPLNKKVVLGPFIIFMSPATRSTVCMSARRKPSQDYSPHSTTNMLSNFTGMISSNLRCAYRRDFPGFFFYTF